MRSLLISLLFLLPGAAHAATSIATEAETRIVANDVVETAMKSGLKPAFDAVKPYWPMDPAEIEGLAAQFGSLWVMMDQRFGKRLGIDYLDTKRIADRLVRHTFLMRYEKHAVAWQLTFYKPDDRWYFNSVKFVDTLDPFFTVDGE